MKELLYSEEKKDLIRFLIKNQPDSIWFNFTSYIFSYPSLHIMISISDDIAATQNKFDEILYGSIEKKDKKFEPSDSYEIVCKHQSIQKAYLMRTLLYFDTFRNFSKTERITNKMIYKIKSLFTGKKDPFLKLWSETNGGGAEYTCNPNSDQAKEAIPEYSNLIDTGVLFEIDGKYIKAYTVGNAFGFHVQDNKYLVDVSELEDEPNYYDAIKIE